MNVSSQDGRFVNAVEAIYATAAAPDEWPRALTAIADVFEDVGTVLIWHRDDGSFGTIVSPSLLAAQEDYQRNWSKHDIRAARSAKISYNSAAPTVVTDRHVCSDEECERHPIYREFLARHGLKWFAVAESSPDPRVWAGISVQRSPAKPPFADAELEKLGKLGRHVESALRLSIRLMDAEASKRGLASALARLGIGVFALDSLKRVVFSNPAGERLLGNGLTVINRRLVANASVGNVALDEALDKINNVIADDIEREPKPILIQGRDMERPLAVYVLPVAADMKPAEEFLTHTRAIVLVINSNAAEPADPAVVRDVLGLTLGEARVAALVGAGLPPREAAEKLGITEETARTTLKRVFSKVGVSRQSELATLLTKLVLR